MAEPVASNSQTPKIKDARNVITGIVSNPLSESLNIGLVALGHLTRSCQNNVEIILDPGLGKPNSSVLNSLNIKPGSFTPLAESIRMTGNLLLKNKKIQEQKVSIVLVSDGIETCDGDPVAEVKKLKQQGLEFIFHAIGYGTDSNITQKLKTLAEAGGGKLFNPNNSGQLQNDLNESIYGFGQFNLIKPEIENIQGWKLYEGVNPILQVARTSKSSELLWQPQTIQVGKYELCVSFNDKVVAKRVEIITNKVTSVDSAL